MAVDNPLKSGPSGGNYSTPDLPKMSEIVVQHLESGRLDRTHSLAGTMNGYLADG